MSKNFLSFLPWKTGLGTRDLQLHPLVGQKFLHQTLDPLHVQCGSLQTSSLYNSSTLGWAAWGICATANPLHLSLFLWRTAPFHSAHAAAPGHRDYHLSSRCRTDARGMQKACCNSDAAASPKESPWAREVGSFDEPVTTYLIFWQSEVNHLSAACSGLLREGGENLSQERCLKGEGGK